MDKNSKTIISACYITNIICSATSCVSPLLFLTLKTMYNISYSLLGLLIVIGFLTQLFIDLIFTFFSKKFNINLCVILMPILSVVGLIMYGLTPWILPHHEYIGLVISTFFISISSGLVEVLLSPLVAALPSSNPDKEVSKLHSVFAWGVVGIVIVFSLFMRIFGYDHWQYFIFIITIFPILSIILFSISKLPNIYFDEKQFKIKTLLKNKWVWLGCIAIFVGGATENIMSQWASTFLELSVGIPKVYGDIFGVAMFSLMLGLGRTLYSKYGKHLSKIMIIGSFGATICYIIAGISMIPFLGLICCGLTGFCVSMLWPGNLIECNHKVKNGGVVLFAFMAAGGDLGASVGPQLIGIITDAVAKHSNIIHTASQYGLNAEQVGMKLAILICAIFPIISTIISIINNRYYRKNSNK